MSFNFKNLQGEQSSAISSKVVKIKKNKKIIDLGVGDPNFRLPKNYLLKFLNNVDYKKISYHLFEVYKDSAALDFHRTTSHYKNYRAKIADLLDKPIEVKVLTSIDSI